MNDAKKSVLIIGGIQDMGFGLANQLFDAGHRVTVLSRHVGEKDGLPPAIARLRLNRTEPQQLRRALIGKSFDAVVDFSANSEQDAATIIDLFKDQLDHYIVISTGQVYLVREMIERPYSEDEYEGRLLPMPKQNTYAFEEWRYGMSKREVEDRFAMAYHEFGFPYTALRLPMVNSERDQFQRLYNYVLRVKDGGPILVPETPTYSLRNVYSGDVINAINYLIDTGKGKGDAYNLSQDETVTIDEFIAILARIIGTNPQIVRIKQSILEAHGFLPDCSPYSDRWMSELTNDKSKQIGITYTPLPDYLAELVAFYEQTKPSAPVSYKRRQGERQLAAKMTQGEHSND